MFERFTDRARRVVVLAQEQARLLDHDYIGTEHIFLGVVQEGEGAGAQALTALAVTLERAQAAVAGTIGRGTDAPSGHVPFTPGAKRLLEDSLREALQLGHDHIGTEHITLCLLDARDDTMVRILDWLGIDPDALRARVIALAGGEGVPGSARPARAWSRRQLIAPTPPVRGTGPQLCSFCDRDLWEVDHYVEGSRATICAACLDTAATAIDRARESAGPPSVMLPPGVFGTEPAPGTVDAIVATIQRVFGLAAAPVAQPEWIEDGEHLAPLFAEVQRRYAAMSVAIRLERLRFDREGRVHARLVPMLVGGTGPPIEGALVLRDGRWIVSRELMTHLLTTAGFPPQPPDG